jgi:hypothetical protein
LELPQRERANVLSQEAAIYREDLRNVHNGLSIQTGTYPESARCPAHLQGEDWT